MCVLFAAGAFGSGAGGRLLLEDVGTFLSRFPLIQLVFDNPFNPSNKELKNLSEMASGDPTTVSKDFIYLKSANKTKQVKNTRIVTFLLTRLLKSKWWPLNIFHYKMEISQDYSM